MTIFRNKRLYLAAAAAFLSVSVFSIASIPRHGLLSAIFGLILLLAAGYFWLLGIGGEGNEHHRLPWNLKRVTRFYINILGVFYLILVLVALVTEGATADFRFALYIVLFGALSVAIGGPVFYVLCILPGWGVSRLAKRFLRKST